MDIIIIALGIFLALMFNFVNGVNDAANSIATIVATKALTPLKAIALASVFNMIGPFIFTTAIAKTIGKSIVDPTFITTHLLLAAMFAAILWVFLSSYFGIPVSSSHALIGGLLGAGIAKDGMGSVLWPNIDTIVSLIGYMIIGSLISVFIFAAVSIIKKEKWHKNTGIALLMGVSITVPLLIITETVIIKGILAVVVFIVVSPMLGMIAAYIFGLVIMYIFKSQKPDKLNKMFQPLQIVAGSVQAIGHGANDAQNAMGMITAMLLAGGLLSEFDVPLWVILASCAAISIGTLLGGWRVVDKMGNKITKIRPYQGLSASVAGGGVLALMTSFGVPVSTTHAMSGAIMGAGATRGYSTAVKWGIVREIVTAWVLTLPAVALVSWLCYMAYAAIIL
ncbi:MAG: inorganic phosphate transporter [Euryarchaeota archaeon]|nr:inorganic phosphate transporter [Euryarchaeota archaeon]